MNTMLNLESKDPWSVAFPDTFKKIVW